MRLSAAPETGLRIAILKGSSAMNLNALCMLLPHRAAAAVLVLALLCRLPLRTRKPTPQLRTVHGSASSIAAKIRCLGVVYLVNVKTQAVKTYIADDSGNYRFSGLDPNTDYEVTRRARRPDLRDAHRLQLQFQPRH